MIIGVDIDNVIADTEKGLREFLYEAKGLSLEREDITSYNLENLPGVTEDVLKEIWDTFDRGDIFLGLDVIDGARETLGRMMESHRVILVTSRTEGVRQKTVTWLEREKIPHHELMFASGSKLNGVPYELFIEDQDTFALELADSGAFVLLYDAPWNRHVEHVNIDRVFSWQDIHRFCFPACAAGK